MAKILWAKTGFRDVPLYRLCSFLWVIPESKTGTSKERGPGLEGTGPSLPWSAHAVSETLSGTSSLTIALGRCFCCENRSLSSLGPKCWSWSLPALMFLTGRSLALSWRSPWWRWRWSSRLFPSITFVSQNVISSPTYPHSNVTSFSQCIHCNVLQVERIRKRHKGNEQAVDMLKVLPC